MKYFDFASGPCSISTFHLGRAGVRGEVFRLFFLHLGMKYFDFLSGARDEIFFFSIRAEG